MDILAFNHVEEEWIYHFCFSNAGRDHTSCCGSEESVIAHPEAMACVVVIKAGCPCHLLPSSGLPPPLEILLLIPLVSPQNQHLPYEHTPS
jgi:hypothetical protein